MISEFLPIARTVLKRRTGRFLWRQDVQVLSCAWYRFDINVKFYHSENGVYGYKSKPQRHYEIPKDYLEIRSRNSNFYRLVTAYRTHAHKQANIDPIALTKPIPLPELQPQNFGLNVNDKVSFRGIITNGQDEGSVGEALNFLNNVYSSSVGVEFNHLETEEEREWFAEATEVSLTESLSCETRQAIAIEMLKSQNFDHFLAKKFVSLKRYGAEGAESMMAFFYEFFKLAAQSSLEHLVLCMPHRGRLNLLVGMLNFPPEKLFRKLQGLSEFPNDIKAIGDVPSHLISSTDLTIDQKRLHVTLLRNPSHLEAVNPVSMGKTRGIMQAVKDGAYSDDNSAQWSDKVLNLQVHGDAAYVGQGVNQECLALCNAPHFEIGGSVHLIINNQIGFTTPPSRGRSSRYCTDLAKMIAAPVIHVNGDEPEMVVRAARIAFMYQRKFRRDVFVDLNCFRRWGHNELDDPTFTNPIIYKIIHNRPSIPDRYAAYLIESNILNKEESEININQHSALLSTALKRVDNYNPDATYFSGRWSGIKQADCAYITQWDTGVDLTLLKFIGERSVSVTNDMNIHPQILKNHVHSRLNKITHNEYLDWSTAEALAIGSLLYQAYNVRISGQDVGRGTFSQRHAMLVNQSTGGVCIPLNSIAERQTGKLELANSILSEEAVLGYEYGMSITVPTTLTIWEAQFGDFFNGAQIIIDTFVTSGEAKWMLNSGLTMLLPHGYDGAGPEHSSCRLERFLQLTDSKENKVDSDDVNIQVANPTTPAQYFHLLRRQMVRNYRKPLVIVAPKTLLRLPSARSSLKDMQPGTGFQNVIGDENVKKSSVKKIILTTGKHYYALENYRKTASINNVAIIRLESLCPFPIYNLQQEFKKYENARYFIWSQEEPRNMGAWNFVKLRFENLCGYPLRYCGRDSIAAPAVGEGYIHQREAQEVITKPFMIKTI